MSISVQLDSGNARTLSPLRMKRVVVVPQLRALVLRIPAMLRVAEGEDALLRARLLLVAARATDRGIERVLVQRLLQRLGLHHVGVHGGAVGQRRDALAHAVLVGVHEHVHVAVRRDAVTERDHLAEFPGGIDVQQRHRRPGGIKRLAQQVQQHRGILADRIQRHRMAEGRLHLAEDVDALRLQVVEMERWLGRGGGHDFSSISNTGGTTSIAGLTAPGKRDYKALPPTPLNGRRSHSLPT